MNEQKVVDMYTKEKMSTYEIAKFYDTYPNKIRRILLKRHVDINSKSEAQKNALKRGKAKIPTLGKKRSKEEKLKISKSLQKYWNNLSEEDYNEIIHNAKKRWSEIPEAEKKAMGDLAIRAIRLAGKEGSKLEKFLREELSKHGHNIQYHKKNLIPNENLEIDMYFPSIKTVVEIDGPSHFMPIWGEEKLRKQIKADAQKNGLILSKGFAIIRVKCLKNSMSLHDRETLKNKLLEILSRITTKFPAKSDRYIEIET